MLRFPPILFMPLAAAALSGCTAGDRGIVSRHQPVVADGRAAVPGCPDWAGDRDLPEHEGQSANFGCAAAVNLAAMIADPNDLIHGRRATGADAETAAKAIRAWRELPPTGKAGIEKVSAKSN